MKTLPEIKQAIEGLSKPELYEVICWMDDRREKLRLASPPPDSTANMPQHEGEIGTAN